MSTHPPAVVEEENHENMVNVDHDTWSIPEDSLFPILAGEQPVPVPRNNYWAFRSVQQQLDEYIVKTLPKEFWGSEFYLASSKHLERSEPLPVRSEVGLEADVEVADVLCEKANAMQVDMLKFFRKRVSKKRAMKAIVACGEELKDIVGDEWEWCGGLMASAVERAKKRMEVILEDISKKKPYRCRSAIKRYCCLFSTKRSGCSKRTIPLLMLPWVLLLLLAVCHSRDLVVGDPIHVSIQYQHAGVEIAAAPHPLA